MRQIQWFLCVLLIVTGIGLAPVRAAEETVAGRLHALFDAEWEWTLRESPTFASHLGDRRYNDRWPDVSVSAIGTRHRHKQQVLPQLDRIDVNALDSADQLNYRLFRKKYATDVEEHQYRWYLLPLNQRGGIQDANSLADELSFERLKDYQDWIARLDAFPRYMDQTIELMRAGIRAGMVHPKIVMQRIPAQIEAQIVDDPAKSPFFKPFQQFSATIGAADQSRLSEQASRAIAENVVPAYRRMKRFFEDEYLPACLDNVGVWQLPRGRELYAFEARKFTTTDLTPDEIHAIGQREVLRIRRKMEQVLRGAQFQGSFAEFLEFLRTDPQFYYRDPDELLRAYRAIAKRIDPGLVKLFGRLPRMPYGVEPIPMQLAPDTTTGYYRQPAADGSRAGSYFVNLYRPEVRPKYEMEVLSLHEAVPGHHLQIALAMELEGMPKFRRYTGYTAFVEGWALYGESLGDELGCYRDPYSRFGQLTYEMWRAVRLVVDTGIHSLQWSRRQSIDFFAANTAKTRLDIENEVDRYIAWPGQALAYKIGELKIKQLRARAERELGDAFDARAFHDRLLSNGAVPLDVLEQIVEKWIVAQEASLDLP